MSSTSPLAAALCLLTWASAACAGPQAVPTRIEATYQVLYNGMPLGVVKETFEQRKGGRYRITSRTEPAPALAFLPAARQSMSSEGTLDGRGLRPARFEHQRGDDPNKNARAEFNWTRGELVMSRGGERQKVPLADGVQDRLSALYQLPYLSLDRLANFDISLTNGRKLSTYRYTITREPADTPMGRFDALHLVGQTDEPDRRQEVWLSTGKHRVVVRLLVQERPRERFEQVLSALRVEPASP